MSLTLTAKLFFHLALWKLRAAQLAAVRVPALEIIGSADPNLSDAQELRKAMPALKVVVVDGATHGGERGVLRRPELLAALREFHRLRMRSRRTSLSRRHGFDFRTGRHLNST